jgi:hypothetical protein
MVPNSGSVAQCQPCSSYTGGHNRLGRVGQLGHDPDQLAVKVTGRRARLLGGSCTWPRFLQRSTGYCAAPGSASTSLPSARPAPP